MSDTTQTVINRQDPAIEAYRLGLLGDVQEFVKNRIASGDMPPDYQVAEMSPAELAGVQAAMQGIGAYSPFLTAGSQTIQQGQQLAASQAAPALMQGIGAVQQGIGSLAGTGAGFDPSQIQPFMNPYEDAAVQQALSDIRRQGDIAQQGVRAQAVGAGAFGGSRTAIAEQELQRNVMDQMGRTAAQMRTAGYESAANRAQQAFEQQMGRQQQVGALTGQLGQGIGSIAGQIGALGGQLGQLGIQQAGIGELQTNLGSQDIQNLMTTGGVERGVAQSTADAQRLTNLQRYSQPYQQYGFLSDIYSGIPTGQMVTTASSSPQVSPFQTAVGLGISGLSAAAGAQRAGII